LDGNAPEELSPRISFLISGILTVRGLASFTTYKLDRLAVPVPAKVKGDPSWNFEREFWAEFEKPITEIYCDEVLIPCGTVNP
jgi:hypothetical protein